MICRSSGLEEQPEYFKGMLQTTRVLYLRPDARINSHLSFASTRRIASLEIMRWIKHGSILRCVENFSEWAGGIDGIRAENFVAREIMMVERTLATILDEFHPANVIFSAAVERLVLRLVILEEYISVDKEKLNLFYQNKMVFLGIEGGYLASTRELL